METFQWEDKQPTVPFWVHMISGSIAGLSQHLSMLPLDNVKTHCQAGNHLPLSQIIRNIYSVGGLSNFYSGSSTLALGCIPAHAIYFSIYQESQKRLNCTGEQNHYKFALVGMASALFHDLIMTPAQVLKQRLQLSKSVEPWVQTKDLVKSMYKNQGWISFYRSFGINFMMSLPFNSAIVFFNEKLKHMMNIKPGDHHLSYYLCGGIAGALAAVPTTPFDVIKTKLNTQDCWNKLCQKRNICEMKNNKSNINSSKQTPIFDPYVLKRGFSHQKKASIKYRNIVDTTFTIWRQEGASGFFTGVKFRMAIQSVSSAIAWGTYHLFKNIIYPQNKMY